MADKPSPESEVRSEGGKAHAAQMLARLYKHQHGEQEHIHPHHDNHHVEAPQTKHDKPKPHFCKGC
jgi:hypothetical protein